MKYWEIIADNLHDAGWSLGWVSAIDCEGRTIWIVDAHRDDGSQAVATRDEAAGSGETWVLGHSLASRWE
jgi:hypothetical protein